MEKIVLYNTLTRRKETFEPINPEHVGMYVCGPTVYGDPHLGHARPAVTFDLLFRYLQTLGYKVRYVRNITDVGHLEQDADDGEDKIAKKARLEQLEPMEIAHYYTERYHDAMRELGVKSPSIEPHASGHIIEHDPLERLLIGSSRAMKGALVRYGYPEGKIFDTYDSEKPHNEESWRLILAQSFSYLLKGDVSFSEEQKPLNRIK